MKGQFFILTIFVICLLLTDFSSGAEELSSESVVKREALAAREPLLSRVVRAAGARGQGAHGCGGSGGPIIVAART